MTGTRYPTPRAPALNSTPVLRTARAAVLASSDLSGACTTFHAFDYCRVEHDLRPAPRQSAMMCRCRPEMGAILTKKIQGVD